MGYGVYWVSERNRWEGYMVPGPCDWPTCEAEIDHGLGTRCEDHDYGYINDEGEEEQIMDGGCELTFCGDHLYEVELHAGIKPKPDSLEWIGWVLTDESWAYWRSTHRKKVAEYHARLEN